MTELVVFYIKTWPFLSSWTYPKCEHKYYRWRSHQTLLRDQLCRNLVQFLSNLIWNKLLKLYKPVKPPNIPSFLSWLSLGCRVIITARLIKIFTAGLLAAAEPLEALIPIPQCGSKGGRQSGIICSHSKNGRPDIACLPLLSGPYHGCIGQGHVFVSKGSAKKQL